MNRIQLILKNYLTLLLLLGFACDSSAQIDMSDTTAAVIAFWHLNETQTYKVSNLINTTEEDKVIASETVLYDLSIKIIDSTEAGYLLEWTRTNYDVNTENDFDIVLLKIAEDIPFWITTDEYGSSVQVLNWEDVGNEIKKRVDILKEAHKDFPERIKKLNKLIRQSGSKESVEMNLIPDVLQFLAFHGAKYKFDERIDMQIKVPNNFGGDPLDANTALIMDQVNMQQGTIIIRSSQRINPRQLTAVTYDYLASLNMIGAELPPFEEFPIITKLIWGGSEIHVNSGWIIYSVETKQTNNDKMVTVEERTIELVRDGKN
jgi:hypothetical protein